MHVLYIPTHVICPQTIVLAVNAPNAVPNNVPNKNVPNVVRSQHRSWPPAVSWKELFRQQAWIGAVH